MLGSREPLVVTAVFAAFLVLRADRPFVGMLLAGAAWTLRPDALLFAGLLAGFVAIGAARAAAPAAPGPKPDASAAIEKTDPSGRFRKMHESFLARGKEGPIGVLFVGDSITQGWTKAPHVWAHYYGKWQPANFGIGGDQTQHVIWRIENGELDGIRPKVAVLMLGTNNTRTHDAAEIAAANRKIVGMIRAKIPGVKVLVLAVFPRGPRPDKDGNITPEVAAEAARQLAAGGVTGVRIERPDLEAVFLTLTGRSLRE